MKLLFDQNLSFKLCSQLADLFPGSEGVRVLKLDQASDGDIWNFAGTNGFVLVSQDTDFADRAVLFGPPPKVIWLRCGNQPTSVIQSILRSHAQVIEAFEAESGAAYLEIY